LDDMVALPLPRHPGGESLGRTQTDGREWLRLHDDDYTSRQGL
jgi:hypothetical protein